MAESLFDGIRHADWDGIEKDMVEGIHFLKHICEVMKPGRNAEIAAKGLLYPCAMKLAEFKIIIDRVRTEMEKL